MGQMTLPAAVTALLEERALSVLAALQPTCLPLPSHLGHTSRLRTGVGGWWRLHHHYCRRMHHRQAVELEVASALTMTRTIQQLRHL